MNRHERRRRRRQAVPKDPYLAQRAARVRQYWPQMSAGLVGAFAQGPFPPDHPVVRQAAKMNGRKPQPGDLLTPPEPSDRKKASKFQKFNFLTSAGKNNEALDLFFGGPGKYRTKLERWQALPDEKKRGYYDSWAKYIDPQGQANFGTAQVAKREESGGIGGVLGAVASPFAATAASTVASAAGAIGETAQSVAGGIAENVPDLDTAANLATPLVPLLGTGKAAVEGIQTAVQGGGPAATILGGALGASTNTLSEIGGLVGGTSLGATAADKWDQTFGKVFKPAVRWAATAANAPYEVLTGRARAIAGGDLATAMPLNPLGLIQGIKEIPGLWDQTTVGQAAQGKDLGEGYLPGGQAVRAQARAARENSPYLPGGHAWTPGRGLADAIGRIPGLNEVFEPDSFAWEVTSGLVDATAAWKLDPQVLVAKETSRIRESARSVRAEEHGVDVAQAFKSPKGKGLMSKFQQAETAAGVRLAGGTALSHDAASAIAKTDQADDIVRIVANDTIGAQVTFLQEAGAHYSHRRWTNPLTQKEWLASEPMTKLKEELVGIKSPAEVRLRLGPKFPGETPDGANLWVDLAKAESTQEVDNVLYQTLGLMDDVPTHSKPGYLFRRAKKDVRAFGIMPDQNVLMNDNVPYNVEQLDRLGLNAKVPWEKRRQIIDDYLLEPQSAPNRYKTVKAAGRLMEESMISYGMDPEFAKQASTVFRRNLDEHGTFVTNLVADSDGFNLRGFIKDGEPVNFAQSPLNEAEFLGSVVPMPDVREIRQATSMFAPLLRHPKMADYVEPLAEWLNRQWKFFTLARPAWPVRVVGEGQFRMAAAGLDTFLGHPVGALLTVVGTPRSALAEALQKRGLGKTAAKLRRVETKHGKFDVSTRGAPLAEEEFITDQVLNKGFAQITEPYQRATKSTGYFQEVDRSNPQAHIGLTQDLGRLSDPVMRKTLSSESPEEVKHWFSEGEGVRHRDYIASNENLKVMQDNREFSDVYIDGQYERADLVTGGDPRLREALATGKIDGESLLRERQYNPEAAKKIRAILDEGAGPARVKIDSGLLQAPDKRIWDRTVHTLMYHLMGRPENFINRSSAGRQFYWKHAERMAPYLDPAEADELIKNARAANLGDDAVKRITDRAHMKTDPKLQLTAEQHDIASQAAATKDTLDLLYDMGRRHQFWDMTRLAFPFGEAWQEVLSRWAKIYWKNPAALRHAQVAIQGARGSGFFHKNDFGDEVYTNPISGWANQLNGSIGPIPVGIGPGAGAFESSVSGLNVVGEMMPGVGWAGQVLAKNVIPDTPDWDWLRDKVFPFGTPEDTGNPLYDVIETAGSGGSFVRRMLQAHLDPDRFRGQASRVHHYENLLMGTGDYKLNGPKARQEMQRLKKDALDYANRQMVWTAIVGAVLPSAPSMDNQVYDKKGKLVDYKKAQDDWQKIKTETKTYDEALFKFAKKWGDNNLLITQAFSEPTRGHLPITEKASQWARSHRELAELHPEVYGLLAPGYEDEFSSSAYNRQFAADERNFLTPEERLERLNDTKASYLYRRYEEELGDLSDKDRVKLARHREWLRQEYPGFDTRFVTGENEQKISLIKALVEDPKAKKAAPARLIKAANEYLSEREWAINESDGNSLAGEADSERRQYLYKLGSFLSKNVPMFRNMWLEVLRREVED